MNREALLNRVGIGRFFPGARSFLHEFRGAFAPSLSNRFPHCVKEGFRALLFMRCLRPPLLFNGSEEAPPDFLAELRMRWKTLRLLKRINAVHRINLEVFAESHSSLLFYLYSGRLRDCRRGAFPGRAGP